MYSKDSPLFMHYVMESTGYRHSKAIPHMQIRSIIQSVFCTVLFYFSHPYCSTSDTDSPGLYTPHPALECTPCTVRRHTLFQRYLFGSSVEIIEGLFRPRAQIRSHVSQQFIKNQFEFSCMAQTGHMKIYAEPEFGSLVYHRRSFSLLCSRADAECTHLRQSCFSRLTDERFEKTFYKPDQTIFISHGQPLPQRYTLKTCSIMWLPSSFSLLFPYTSNVSYNFIYVHSLDQLHRSTTFFHTL